MKKRFIAILLMAIMMLTAFPPQQTYAASWKLVEDEGDYYCIDQSSGKSDSFDGSFYWNGKYYAQATGWLKIDSKWYYFDPYGGWAYTDSIWEIDGARYAFDEKGVMRTGWIKEVYDGYVSWYYATGSGALAKGWQKIDNKWYYFDEYGFMFSNGTYIINGKKFLFDAKGAMRTGWIKEEYNGYITWYYADSNSGLAAGWKEISGKWYYFDPEYNYLYEQRTIEIGSKSYYLTSSGAMGTGWIKVYENTWYYANNDGVLQKGWQKLNNKWYYFDPEYYYMYTYANRIGNKRYLFNADGSLVSKAGWIKLGDLWYYANADGTSSTGWKYDGGNYYYLDPEWGDMVTSARVIDGVLYTFKSNGVYSGKVTKAGWQKPDSHWFYIKSDGKAALGWEKINGKWYYFDEYAGMASSTALYYSGKFYFFDSSGALVSKAGWQSVTWNFPDSSYTYWYYVDADGVCRTGWQKINNKWYYFYPETAMMWSDGTYVIDGKEYMFDKNGVWIK